MCVSPPFPKASPAPAFDLQLCNLCARRINKPKPWSSGFASCGEAQSTHCHLLPHINMISGGSSEVQTSFCLQKIRIRAVEEAAWAPPGHGCKPARLLAWSERLFRIYTAGNRLQALSRRFYPRSLGKREKRHRFVHLLHSPCVEFEVE